MKLHTNAQVTQWCQMTDGGHTTQNDHEKKKMNTLKLSLKISVLWSK